tara:strand:+ start:3163 stop:4077 length:915 start_codon:yes stop_codon:yes gene_type:complete
MYKKHHSNNLNHGALQSVLERRFAIIIQGPVADDDDFTLSTIELYRFHFPNAIIILSTWPVSPIFLKAAQKFNVHVIQNKPPDNPGISNLNFQITTSSSGVLAAKELGAHYALKTRTDQRIYHPSLETYLFNLIESFPLSNNVTNQASRLVGISLDTLKYRLYGIGDHFLYGHIDDMINYWNIPLDSREKLDKEFDMATMTWLEFSKLRSGGVYLCSEFLQRTGSDLAWTLKDSFNIISDRFVIIDSASIKMYWHKYTINDDRYSQFGIFDPELSFNDWLILYGSMKNLIIDEEVLDKPIIKVS